MITPSNALVVLLITQLCLCQLVTDVAQTAAASTTQPISTTQGAVQLTVGPLDPVCSDCYIEAATSSDTLQAATDIIFTAYSATSVYTTSGVYGARCITSQGPAVVLSTFYTVTSPTTVAISDFNAYAASEFISYLGFATCAGGANATIIGVQNGNPTTSASLSAGANSTGSSILQFSTAAKSFITPEALANSGLGVRLGVGVSIAFLAFILIFLAAYIWHKRKLRSATISAAEQGKTKNKQGGISASQGSDQPYLQQKAELEAKERQRQKRRRRELEGQQKIHELDGGAEIREVPAGIHEHRTAVMTSRHELTGGEYSQELDT